MIKIRAFKAIDDRPACEKYVFEHMQILKVFGITKITTANNSWMFNPNVYVIMAESLENGEALGGARIQVYDEENPLPIVVAVKDFDPSVVPLVREYHKDTGTAEICGLWNSRSVAGLGIGTLFLSRAGVALAAQLPIKSMFVLCGEHTIGITMEKGFVIEERLGNKGTFYYPKQDLVATAAVMHDVNDLSHANVADRELIQGLRNDPTQTRVEMGPKGNLVIQYDLKLK